MLCEHGGADRLARRVGAARREGAQRGMAPLTDAVIPRWFTADFIERETLVLALIRDVFVHTAGDGYASNCDAIRDADLRAEATTSRRRCW